MIAKWMLEYGGYGEEHGINALKQAAEEIKALPSAQPERCEDCENFSKTRSLIPQPERKTGRWIVIPAPDDLHCGLVKCPFCGELLVGEPNEYNFCSNCGADMRGEDNG